MYRQPLLMTADFYMKNQYKRNKKKKKLSRAIVRVIMAVALFIFFVSTLLNWNFTKSASRYLISLAGFSAATSTKAMAETIDGFEEFAVSVMDTYRSIPDGIRSSADSAEYRACFAEFEESGFYRRALSELKEELTASLIIDTYLAMYDPETSALVYLFDPDLPGAEDTYPVGFYEVVADEEIRAFKETDEEGRLYSYESNQNGKNDLLTIGNAMRSNDGTVIAYAMADVPAAFISIISIFLAVLYLIILGFVILIVVVIARVMIRRRVVRPINRITGAAEAYTNGRRNGVVSQRYFSGLSIGTRDELDYLGEVMSDMEDDIAQYERNLMRATAANERVQTEMSVAARIQMDMLPNRFPPFPGHPEFDIYASMDPAKEVGGDFYDFFLTDDRHLGIVIADVAGKGIPAALFMMSTMIIINNYASVGYSPGEVLRRSNEKICSANTLGMFVTVWFGILDLSTGVVTAANAGHEFPAIRHAGGNYELMKDPHGFVLGGMEGMKYKEYSFTLEPGASFFVYTDGVAEAANPREEMYGTERMLKTLNRVQENSPEMILEAVRKDIDDFAGDAPQFDDLTMLCLTYHGLTPDETKYTISDDE